MTFDSHPASDYPMPDLVDALNRGFEDYFIPVTFNVIAFLNMARKDGIDLTASRVLIADGEPAGIALIAHRGWSSRLAAMGIAKEWRGRGAGSWFMQHVINEARLRGEREMVLEVIEQNHSAVHLYQKCGFTIVRRLIGLIRRDAVEEGQTTLEEMDIREVARLILRDGLADLPWQLSGESIALMSPPARAYRQGPACVVISNPEAKDIAIWSLLVGPASRGNALGTALLRALIAQHPGKTWHVPALMPEELGQAYERAGFVREELSQWQMSLLL